MNIRLQRSIVVVIIVAITVSFSCFGSNNKVYAETMDVVNYTVKYIESGEDGKVLAEKIVRNHQVGESVREYAASIEGYHILGEDYQDFNIGEKSEITFAYEKNSIIMSYDTELEKDLVAQNTIEPRGSEKPVSTWDVVTKGQYNMSCDVNISRMFSNYWFKGTTKYIIGCRNNRTTPLTITARGWLKKYDDLRILSDLSMSFTMTMDSASDKFYVQLDSDDTYIDMTGYVRKF